jgi:hypothetical protein
VDGCVRSGECTARLGSQLNISVLTGEHEVSVCCWRPFATRSEHNAATVQGSVSHRSMIKQPLLVTAVLSSATVMLPGTLRQRWRHDLEVGTAKAVT